MTEKVCSLSEVLIGWPRLSMRKRREGVKVAQQIRMKDHAGRLSGRYPYYTRSLFLGGKSLIMAWQLRATKVGQG